jgi:Tn3 transposase DDE domain
MRPTCSTASSTTKPNCRLRSTLPTRLATRIWFLVLRYLLDEPPQRRIGVQINKGEALHALRGFLFVANEGKIRRHYDEEQLNQVSCLNLVTNAVVLWKGVQTAALRLGEDASRH